MVEKDIASIIAVRIKVAREQAGLSQAKVAKLLGVNHRPIISQIEAGQRKVSAEEIAKLSEIFKVSMTWLNGLKIEDSESIDPKIELAARELSKINKKDLDKVLNLLSSLRKQK